MMEQYIAILSPLVSALLAFAGSYLAFTNRITRLEALIETLSDRVEKHNNVIERVYKLEGRVDALDDHVKIGGTE